MKVTRAGLERRTANLNQYLIDAGLHPDPENYTLMLDYAACYGGYKMIFTQKSSPYGEHNFFLNGSRMNAATMEQYQQGLFDMLFAIGNKKYEVKA